MFRCTFLTATIVERVVAWGIVIVLAIVLLWACLTLISILLGWSQELREWIAGRAWRYSLRELLVIITAMAVSLWALSVLVRWVKAM